MVKHTMNKGGIKMICSKCGNEITDDSLFCSMCGNDLRKTNETSIAISNYRENRSALNKYVIVLGIIACILFFISANQISSVGKEMILLRSQSGTSLAEVYYQDVGKALDGFAMFARALGISILGISFAFGSNNRKITK
jgi:Predicted membrane protein